MKRRAIVGAISIAAVLGIVFFGVGFFSRDSLVILISIDGARADRLRDGDFKNIHSLAQQGAWTYNAKTVLPSRTLPAHASLISGYDVPAHGITWDEWTGTYLSVPSIFDELVARDKPSFAFVGKEKMRTFRNMDDAWELNIIEGGSRRVMDEARRFIASGQRASFLFIHLPNPDKMGHAHGESSREYAAALGEADGLVGELIATLREERKYDQTTLIITADHGMLGNHHGGSTPEETTIPWIVSGKSIKKQYEITEPVDIFDTAPTILSLFSIQPRSGMDGRVLKKIFQ